LDSTLRTLMPYVSCLELSLLIGVLITMLPVIAPPGQL